MSPKLAKRIRLGFSLGFSDRLMQLLQNHDKFLNEIGPSGFRHFFTPDVKQIIMREVGIFYVEMFSVEKTFKIICFFS